MPSPRMWTLSVVDREGREDLANRYGTLRRESDHGSDPHPLGELLIRPNRTPVDVGLGGRLQGRNEARDAGQVAEEIVAGLDASGHPAAPTRAKARDLASSGQELPPGLPGE